MDGFRAARDRTAMLLTLSVLVTVTCLTQILERRENPMETATLGCALEVLPAGGGEVGLAFTIRNPGRQPVAVEYYQPYADFDLTASAADGDVPIVQPAYDTGVETVALTIAPGGMAQIMTPIRLHFDPNIGPAGSDVQTLWTLVHAPAPVVLRATPRLDGATVGSCEARWDPRQTR